ncbi:M24 family metallopeptidase [Pseudohalocynthiibacter aestuariivivens]|jgi:Xaa-Pro aminopeptidase|uniref:M24 family metallopeptidase n=1 Tax=Pseudohalocynthiibacter aestuariivivens TaxID=1591409 RepID=A0ABV5J9W4_9RHOB|nr:MULTISPECIES: Xaa-Pro peptidase family protein [Pseudohalocynthiibacter]MBS9716826.1 aminopeptidase P family protein [Pseudohalocynthiibacter aestuariivivens]MCK0102081.1 Xaa-Pro peptidase family protein [Pseudohalocynthiibacter sp. F2068]
MPEVAPKRGFEIAEYETRLSAAQYLMARHGFDGMLLLSEPEIRYFSGFQTLFWQSPTRPWFLFLPAEGKPIAVIPEIGAALMRRTWVDDIRSWSAPAPSDDGISLLIDLLTPYSKRGATIGILKGHETGLRMPLGDYERLISGLPGLKIGDATDIIRSLRMVKSEAEIEKIAHICRVASRTFDKAGKLFFEGQPLSEVFRAFRMACLSEGADDVPYLVGGADQGGYNDVISPPTDRPLQRGDILMLDTGSVFDGYFCDFDRNFAIGKADELSQKAYEVLYHATEAGLDAARPGVTCRELFSAMQDVISTFDKESGDVGRLGHGLGMQLTEWPSHAAFDETVLKEDMVITLEPSLSYGSGRIMVHEENIVIRDGTPRLLSKRAVPELPVIG